MVVSLLMVVGIVFLILGIFYGAVRFIASDSNPALRGLNAVIKDMDLWKKGY